jgi:hypothetical protein
MLQIIYFIKTNMREFTILPKIQDFELDMIDNILEDNIPEDVRIYLKQYGGSSILECYYTDSKGLEWELNQFNLFHDLFKLTKEFKENGWGLKLPFAYDPGGWHYCLSFDKETYGKIIINRWTDHSPEEQFVIIAESFEEFINGLEKNPEELI